MRRLIFLGWMLSSTLFTPALRAQETNLVQIPPTLFGPTGLLFTQSTDTLPPGRFALGLSVIHEDSTIPDFTVNEAVATLTAGLNGRTELSVQVPYMFNFERAGNTESGLRDVNLSFKWRVMDQNMEMNLPAFGLSLTYYTPTTDDANRLFATIDTWGVKALLVSSAEVDIAYPVGSYIVGFYIDGGVFIRDEDDDALKEKHGIVDAGILLPLNESRQLHLLLEANATAKNNLPLEGNYTAATAAVRYVTSVINLTAGAQFRFKRDDFIDDTQKLILQASLLF